jgi:GWxTD domain-containing protein
MLRSTLVLAVLAAFSLNGIPLCHAQENLARSHIQTGLAFAANGDTAAALAQFREAVAAAPTLAETHFQLGRLLARKASSIETDFQERDAAAKTLRKAIFLDPDNSSYFAEYGLLLAKQHKRVDAERVLERALEKADKPGFDDLAFADVYFTLGWIQEVRYERERDRRLAPPLQSDIKTSTDLTSWVSRYVDSYLEGAPRIEDSGEETREIMLDHYWTALEHDPSHFDAARRLLVPLIEEDRLNEYFGLVRRLARAHPNRSEIHLYEGLGLHIAGREEEAGAAFDRALEGLSEKERQALLDLGPILRRDKAELYAALDDTARARAEESYWRLTDPIYLTGPNERRLEHMARVAYTDLRFSAPATGLRGWETDRGVIFIRYGPPTEIANMGTIVWRYGRDGPVFMFEQKPGYIHARFAGDYKWVADEYRHLQPAVYGSIPSIADFSLIPMQIARFRGESADWIAVEFHTELPLEKLAEDLDIDVGTIETGIFLRNWNGEEITKSVHREILHYREASAKSPIRCWRVHLPAAGELIVGVEARDPLSWRAAVARDVFRADYFPADSLSVSDILLADHIRLLSVRPSERSHFDIAPNAGREYVRNQRLWLYYELYGLQPDSEGYASFDVALAIKVTALDREDQPNLLQMLGLLADTWGFSIVGDDRIELRFSREADLADSDRVTEYHSVDLTGAPPGEYEIILQIWDRVAERRATSTRTFSVARAE